MLFNYRKRTNEINSNTELLHVLYGKMGGEPSGADLEPLVARMLLVRSILATLLLLAALATASSHGFREWSLPALSGLTFFGMLENAVNWRRFSFRKPKHSWSTAPRSSPLVTVSDPPEVGSGAFREALAGGIRFPSPCPTSGRGLGTPHRGRRSNPPDVFPQNGRHVESTVNPATQSEEVGFDWKRRSPHSRPLRSRFPTFGPWAS